MSKLNFLKLGENRDGFKINPEKAIMGLPDGISDELIWNLWDIGSKYGHEFRNGLGFKAGALILEFNDFRDNGMGGKAGMTVAIDRGTGLMDQGIYIFELENGIVITWDKGLMPRPLVYAIKALDEYFILEGMMENGIRIAIFDQPSSASKYSVEKIFAEKGAVMMALPHNLAETLQDFDHPELLAVIEMGVLKLICLASEKDKIMADMETRFKKLEEMGIDLDKMEGMPIEEIMRLRKVLKLS